MKSIAACLLILSASISLSEDKDSLDVARGLWQKGNYREAFEKYDAMKSGDRSAIALGKARCLSSEGKYAEATKVLETALKPPTDPKAVLDARALASLEATLAELNFDLGNYDKALSLADHAVETYSDQLPARWIRSQTLTATGRYEAANKDLEWFAKYYNQKQPKDPDELLLIAKATAEYSRWNKLPDEFDFILNELLVDAGKAREDFWQAHCEAGLLCIDKYDKARGVPELKKALEINPSAVEALVGLGVSALQELDYLEGNNFADQALAVNSSSAPALRLKADLLLADSRTPQAMAELKKALAVNPHSEETLAGIAACHYLLKQPAEAKKIEAQILKQNPKPGLFYHLVAEPLEARRQFDIAEQYYTKAIEAAPHLAAPLNGLGMLFMRVGKEDEARKVFALARKLDPFHVRVFNWTKVLEHMENYKVIKTDHYEVYYRPDLDEMLAQYMSEHLEMKHPELCKRFGYNPPGRSKIDLMVDHKWFSARVVGLPSVGTVGACTGKVVALTSPRSLQSSYHWARVLTHEVTHIITLQQTNFNIPHWYTEALAVLSEGFPRPQVWNQLLVERVPKNDLLNLDTINHAFVRPKTPLDWQMAYCQAVLYAEFMLERFGSDSLAKLLAAYQAGLETDVAIPKTFNISKADFEKGYREHLSKVLKTIKVGEAKSKRTFAESEAAYRAKPNDPDIAAELALHHYKRQNVARARELAEVAVEKRKNHPLASYILARMEFSIGKPKEAMAILEPAFDPKHPTDEVIDLLAALRLREKNYEEAAKLYELARSNDPLNQKWVEGVAKVRLLQNDSTKLGPILEILAGMDADNLTARQKLADLAFENKDWKNAERWAREVMYVEVAEPRSHRILGEAFLSTGRPKLAVREFENAGKLKSKDAELPYRLAEALHAAGESKKATDQLRTLLKANADDKRAKELLERIEKATR